MPRHRTLGLLSLVLMMPLGCTQTRHAHTHDPSPPPPAAPDLPPEHRPHDRPEPRPQHQPRDRRPMPIPPDGPAPRLPGNPLLEYRDAFRERGLSADHLYCEITKSGPDRLELVYRAGRLRVTGSVDPSPQIMNDLFRQIDALQTRGLIVNSFTYVFDRSLAERYLYSAGHLYIVTHRP